MVGEKKQKKPTSYKNKEKKQNWQKSGLNL